MFDVMTWVSIGVLVVGAVAVFAWFLLDLRRLWEDPEPDRGGGARGGSHEGHG